MIPLIVITFIIILFTIRTFVSSGGHPLLLYLLAWSAAIFLWVMDRFVPLVGYTDLSSRAWWYMLTCHLFFIIGCFTISLLNQGKRTVTVTRWRASKALLSRTAILLFVLSALGYIVYIRTVIGAVGSQPSILAFFIKWNYESTIGELRDFGGLAGRLVVLPGIALPFNVYCSHFLPEKRWTLLFMSILEFLFLVSPRRAWIIQSICTSIFVAFYVRGANWRTFRRGLTVLAAIIAVFALTQIALNKSGGVGLEAGLLSAYVYTTANIPAMDLLLASDDLSYGEYVFNVPLRVLNTLGFIDEIPDLSIPFVEVPVATNTIPYFYYPLHDFGLIGGVIFCWILGSITTAVFYGFRYQQSFHGIGLMALIGTGLLFSIRENMFITYDFWYFVALLMLFRLTERYISGHKGAKYA